jgi:hypothetical protein
MRQFMSVAVAALVAISLLKQESRSTEMETFSNEAADKFSSLFVPAILISKLDAVTVPSPMPAVVPVALSAAKTANSFAIAPGETGHPALGTYSIGYRIGQLSKFSVKGMIKSGEGELLVGNESTYLETSYSCGTKEKPESCTRVINPWSFSSDKEKASMVNPHIGEYVVIKYEQAMGSIITRDTEYELLSIFSPKADSKPQACFPKSYKKGNKSEGIRVGRLVKLSLKGMVSETFEATMQVGNSGSQFHHMSVSAGEPEFVECVLSWLKSGRKVKVHYSQSFLRNPTQRDTDYDIVSVEPASMGLTQ